MTWEQKIQALMAITDVSLRMRRPGDWYVDANFLRIVGDGMETSTTVSDQQTPEDAVHAYWLAVTALASNLRLRSPKGEFRWNGFMWEPQP